MIFVVNFDDGSVAADAYSASHDKATYGLPYCYLPKMKGSDYPKLEPQEHLFITSHGNPAELGDAQGALGFNAAQLANLISPLIPNHYQGKIFVAACESFPDYVYALAEALKAKGIKVEVYGRKGAIPPGRIPGPGDNRWINASFS